MNGFIHITSEDVRKVIGNHLDSLLRSLEDALASYSAKDGRVIQPVRTPVSVSRNNGLFLTMPAYSESEDVFTTKIVTVFPDNVTKNLPSIQAKVMVFDSRTGAMRAIVEGNDLTAIRTAAASAVASKYLASTESKILALLGAGVQARSHLKVLSTLYDFKEVRVWNHRIESGMKLVEEIKEMGFECAFFEKAEDAVKPADIIVTSTLSRTPILHGAWIKPGAHVNAVGACDPTWRELDDNLMQMAKIYVDSEEAALVESGDILLSKAPIFAEIGDVILGKKPALRDEITIFSSQGMAIEDTVAASLVYKHRLEPCSICDG